MAVGMLIDQLFVAYNNIYLMIFLLSTYAKRDGKEEEPRRQSISLFLLN
jgi:hypothetical protein